jgi:hypothetical protein
LNTTLSGVAMKQTGVIALLALSVVGRVTAHRMDEYLQATLIGVTPDSVNVEIRLTPGVAMLPVLMALVDEDRDGRISPQEERAYVSRMIRDVELRVDGTTTPLTLIESKFPTLESMREGLGTIVITLVSARRGHEVHFENRHLPQISAYLVNCLAGTSNGLVVTRQDRDEAQKSIDFEYSFGPDPFRSSGSGAGAGLLSRFWPVAIGVLLLVRLSILIYRSKQNKSVALKRYTGDLHA